MSTPSIDIDLKGLPDELAAAIQRAQKRHCHYSSLKQFAKDFNPLAQELMFDRNIPMDSPSWEPFQQLCIQLFEYGDAKWPGHVDECGVKDV